VHLPLLTSLIGLRLYLGGVVLQDLAAVQVRTMLPWVRTVAR
jgi:hypothetical protein